MPDTGNQVEYEAGHDAPENEPCDEAVQEVTDLAETFFAVERHIQPVQQEGETNKNDHARDAMEDGNNGRQWKMKLAEIEIYWSFAIHSALTLFLIPLTDWAGADWMGMDGSPGEPGSSHHNPLLRAVIVTDHFLRTLPPLLHFSVTAVSNRAKGMSGLPGYNYD